MVQQLLSWSWRLRYQGEVDENNCFPHLLFLSTISIVCSRCNAPSQQLIGIGNSGELHPYLFNGKTGKSYCSGGRERILGTASDLNYSSYC